MHLHHPITPNKAQESRINADFRLPAGLQRKLQVGSANDPQEREADQVAEQVVNQKGGTPLVDTPVMRLIQRQCAACAGKQEEGEVQRKEGDEEDTVQMKGDAGAGFTAPDDVSQRIESQSGKGSALPENTRAEMESGFGTDFSNVRVHTGPEAVQLSRELNAHAFTYGSDIFFNSGKLDTESAGGKKLLAHELTHTVQQGAVKRKVQRANRFDDCSASDQTLINTDYANAQAKVTRAIAELQAIIANPASMSARTQGLLDTHFHTHETSDIQDILGKYQRISSAMAAGVNFECENSCDPGVSGYVLMLWIFVWFGVGDVHICMNLYRTLTTTQRENTLIHEIGHRHAGLDDKAYNWQPEYPNLSKKQAKNNADSYSTFAVSL